MDSNVPKYTNSHKFFQAPFVWESSLVSVKKLVKQLLISIFDSAWQSLSDRVDRQFIAEILERNLKLISPKIEPLFLASQCEQYLFTSELMPIGYSCPLGLSLAASWQISPLKVTDTLKQLLDIPPEPSAATSFLIGCEIYPSGWVNLYLDSSAIAGWLEQSRLWLANNFTAATFTEYSLDQTRNKLFPAQYVHARCCSLLHLGARENLITLKKDWHSAGCQIAKPELISWLNRENRLWLHEEAEYELLRQLLIVADAWQGESEVDWLQIALRLSRVTAIFQANCRFLGTVRVLEPQKAVARLGLIAIVRSWLYLILRDKLKAAAPTKL